MNFKDLSIRRKLTYLYLPFVILPIIVFFYFSTNLYEESIIRRSQESIEDNNLLIVSRIDDVLKESESAATYLTISINTLINNQTFGGNLSGDIKLYNLLSNELTYATLIFDKVDNIAFLDADGRLYYTNHLLYKNSFLINGSDMYKDLKLSSGNNLWFDLDKRAYLTTDNHAVVTLGKKVWNINTGKTIGYLFINISEDTIIDVFDDQVSDYMIYKNGQELTANHGDVYLEDLDTFLASKNNSMIVKKKLLAKSLLERLDWTLISVTNLGALTTDFNNLLVILSLILLAIIVLDIFISLMLNRLISNPIIKLKGGLEEITRGNFDYRFNMKTHDEIGLFAESFNHMSERIKALLDKVELEESQKRTFEMALIQQQIKPHFLYNTLDIILKLSQMGQARKAQKVTKRLADYYKNSLSSGSDIVSVEKEITITEDYLSLQKIRYSDILDFEISLSDHIKGKRIPKLTLQPLVENAIYHGLKYKASKGCITITDELTEDAYYLIVQDNGIGIKLDKFKQLHDYLKKDEFDYGNQINESFGLRNVNHRLKLFFGFDYGLSLYSEDQIGTEVRIKLPKEVKYD